jgi:hypothetical protein
MTRGTLCLVAVLMLLIAGCGPTQITIEAPAATSPPTIEVTLEPTLGPMIQTDESTAAWREDLEYMMAQMQIMHLKWTWRHSPDDFAREATILDTRIPYLTDDQIIMEMARIVSMTGAHSALPLFHPSVGFRLYPLHLYEFADGMFVVEAQPPHEDAVGARLISIGGVPFEDVYAKLAPYIPYDNDQNIKQMLPMWVVSPEVLIALGIIDDADQPQFVIEHPDGQQETINFTPRTDDLTQIPGLDLWYQYVGLPQQPEPLYLSNKADAFWFTYLEDSQVLYIQYNQVYGATATGYGLDRMAREVQEFVAANDEQKIVVDIRHNGGGDIGTYRAFLNALIDNPDINAPGKLFVITSRDTFSAAVVFSMRVEEGTDAIFVGEPGGQPPTLYGGNATFRLPNSDIVVYMADEYHPSYIQDDDRMWIEPDIPVALTSADYFAGRDPALEAILSYTP